MGGWSSPLEEVPDPVFSGKIMGDGVALDPTESILRAPCDGEVITVAAARHAVVVRAANGAEILLHVGCNTVDLGGDGFEVHVEAGRSVRTGDPLITFDLDAIAQRVPSLLSPIVVVEGDRFEITRRAQEKALRAGDFLMELRALEQVGAMPSAAKGPEVRRRVRVPYEHGIHARPAALLARSIAGFHADVHAAAHGRTASARSAVAWMQLGVHRGDEVELIATGRDAEAAIAALEGALDASAQPANAPPAVAAVPPSAKGEPRGTVRGVIASRGFATGKAAMIAGAEPVLDETGKGVAYETAELDRARGVVRAALQQLRASSKGLAAEVLEAHLELLDDPELLQTARDSIAKGKNAGHAWREAVSRNIAPLLELGDARIAERADDLRDLSRQVLRALAGESPSFDPPAGSILVGQELLLSQLAAIPAGRIAGFCTVAGGPTSHVALLAAAMNIPALVAAGPEILGIAEGTPLVLDAEEGLLHVAPNDAAFTSAEEKVVRRRAQREAAQAAARTECRLASGERIEVFANVSAADEVPGAIDLGAEGCGLLRTEFLFLDRATAPTVEEQTAACQNIVTAFGGRPVVIRTLDAGSDKPLRYLPLPHAENPALGVRGIRAGLWRPEILRAQLRAILLVKPLSACRILLPMVTDRAEVESVRAILDELCRELRCAVPPLGVMIETPAAALMAPSLAAVADFLSIGTNDLAQYTLAMDRGQPELAAQFDAMHPAVLHLIRAAATAGRMAGRPVAVCGGLASDPAAAALLIGLGVNELSAVPSMIPEIKAALRAVRLDDCRALAERALASQSAADVRTLAREWSAGDAARAGVNR